MITDKKILEEVTSEAIKLYRDYPGLSIFEAISIANTVICHKYKGAEIVERTEKQGVQGI